VENETKEILKCFATSVKNILNEKNITQQKLADMLHVNTSVVSRWLSGNSNLTMKTMSNICHVLDYNLNVSLKTIS